MVFQDPYSSLNPRMTVADIIAEPLDIHKLYKNKEERKERVLELMGYVGLNSEHAARYAHEFSGGQRQRICIARALALNPEFIVCDEPVSALDVSIQAQIINLLNELQDEHNLSYLFISHDLSVVEHISDSVGVMYLGNLVEYGDTEDIFRNPLHPYTKALFSAIPIPDPNYKMKRIVLEGSIPSPANPPAGCKFHTRCAQCMEICKTQVPEQKEIEPGHFVVCHLYDDVKAAVEATKPAEEPAKEE
jgi:peptide/nickel transport system ATP-binding protein